MSKRITRAPFFVVALFVTAAAVMTPAAGAPVYETELNNTPETANVISLGTEIQGDCRGDIDFIALYLASGRAYGLNWTFALGAGDSTSVGVVGPNGTPAGGFYGEGSGTYGFIAFESGRYTVSSSCSWLEGPGPWLIRIDDAGAAPLVQGPDEEEPNYDGLSASRINASGNYSGIVNGSYDALDQWWVWINESAAVRVSLTAATASSADLTWHEPYIGTYHDRADQVNAPRMEPPGFIFTVESQGPGGAYTLRVEIVEDLSVFYAGPSETEPNAIPADATTIDGTGTHTIRGTLNASYDENDVYLFHSPAGEKVSVKLVYAQPCLYSCPEAYALDADGKPIANASGTEFTFVTPSSGAWYLNVTAGSGSGDYTLEVGSGGTPLVPVILIAAVVAAGIALAALWRRRLGRH
jgi:hypothetical protein